MANYLDHMAAVQTLIENKADRHIRHPETNKNILELASDSGQVNTVKYLLTLPEFKNVSTFTDELRKILRVSSGLGDLSTVGYIFTLPESKELTNVGPELAASNNALLLKAVDTDNLSMVNFILDRNDPEVINTITANENAIIRSAIRRQNSLIEARLRKVPALKHFSQDTAFARNRTLAEIAGHKENAMAAPTRGEQILLDILRHHYLPEVLQQSPIKNPLWEAILGLVSSLFERMTHEAKVDSVLASLSDYLAQKYNDLPALDTNNQPLPLKYNSESHSHSVKSYYQHPVHTAWRYLQFIKEPYAMSITDKETLACLWIAIQKEKCDDNSFIQELSLLCRAHNWDSFRMDPVTKKSEYYDDLKRDNPTCQGGVQKRLLTPLQLLPSMKDIPLLSGDTFKDRFMQHLIAQNPSQPNTIYGKLKGLKTAPLLAIKKALQAKYSLDEGEALTKVQQKALKHLQIEEAMLNGFLEDSAKYYAKAWEAEIQGKYTLDISDYRGNVKYKEGFPAYARDLASDITAHFGDSIMTILDSIIAEKSKKNASGSRQYLPSGGHDSVKSTSNNSANDAMVAPSASSVKKGSQQKRKQK